MTTTFGEWEDTIADGAHRPRRPPVARDHAGAGSDAGIYRVFGFLRGRGSVGGKEIEQVAQRRDVSKDVVALNHEFFEDYGRQLNRGSLDGLTSFFERHAWAAMPSLTAESTGQVIATWRAGRQSVTLRFLNGTTLHYALVLETAAGTLIRPWGTSTRYELFAEQPAARFVVCPAEPA